MEPTDTPARIAPPSQLPALPTDPHIARISDDMAQIMDRAYLEQISRTNPGVFMKFAAQVLNMRITSGHDRAHTVVNVVNAIPRSPLDQLPPGFTFK